MNMQVTGLVVGADVVVGMVVVLVELIIDSVVVWWLLKVVSSTEVVVSNISGLSTVEISPPSTESTVDTSVDGIGVVIIGRVTLGLLVVDVFFLSNDVSAVSSISVDSSSKLSLSGVYNIIVSH